jgi:hypothetical protein
MTHLDSSKGILLVSDLEPEELDSIMDRIDDNLAFWRVIYNEHAYAQDPLPSLAPLGAASDWLKLSSAPLHPSLGVGGVRGIILRGLNLFVKIFGSVQINFNRKFREFLAELITFLHEFERQTANLKTDVNELEKKVQTLEATNNSFQQEIELLREKITALSEQLDRADGDQANPSHKRQT